ncbi:MAG: hypothetical protein KGZ40_06110 [Clostridiales bacterium]|nr:hypothetical protein [Clostridiales bacterium]
MVNDPTYESDPFGRSNAPASRRKIVALLVLLALLGTALWAIYYHNTYRRLPVPGIGGGAEEVVTPPEYLYSITGPEGDGALSEPLGVDVSAEGLVYVTDPTAGEVKVYTVEGEYRFSFSGINDEDATSLVTPVYVEVAPNGEVYVTDRRHRSLYVFSPSGEYLRKVEPADAEEARIWAPLAIAFDDAGNLWVSDVGRNDLHQIIVFDPQGVEIRRFGGFAAAEEITDAPGRFYFPNGIVVRDGLVFVADSNNRRIQVFDETGAFERIIRTSGIPRGIDMDGQGRLYVADALAHQGDIYDAAGERIASFGGPGVGPGQFRYTNDLAVDTRGFIFLTDRVNHQVQVWGWPDPIAPVPIVPETPVQWAFCLSPLVLLPLLLLARRRRFVVTEEFLEQIAAAGLIGKMAERKRWRWIVPAEEFERYKGREINGVALGDLLTPEVYSDSDTKNLMDRSGVSHDVAALLVLARRAKTLCTQDPEIARVARALGIDAYDARLFAERVLGTSPERSR